MIPQRDFFDKDIAVEGNTQNYYIIQKGDFVYNPRKSTTAPYGPFNCYMYDNEGIVSPLYTCLTPKYKEYTEYLLWYFKSSAWYSYIYHNGAQGGARHDRVGMTNELMDGIPVNLPSIQEQHKVSSFLSLLDDLISKQRELVEKLKTYKRGVLEGIFACKYVSSENNSKWKKYVLSDITIRVTRKNNGTTNVPLTISSQYGLVDQRQFFSKVVASKDLSNYYLLNRGEFAYNRSTSSESPVGAVKRLEKYDNGAVSTLYLCFAVNESQINAEILKYYFESSQWHQHIKSICSEGARNHGLLNVPTKEFFDLELFLPESLEAQRKIVTVLKGLQEIVDNENRHLEALYTLKNGLLTQMFI